MSSTISTTDLKAIPSKGVTNLKLEEKQPRLVRSSSIDKIKRFNTFICSQQYYILPALLSWVRSSQSCLQSSTEKTIFLFRSIIFNTYFYKLFKLTETLSIEKIQTTTEVAALYVIANFYQKFTKCFESTFLLAAAVYMACGLVVIQFIVALCLIYTALMPYGFVFLVSCMITIKYLCYKTLFYFMRNNHKRDIRNKM